MMFLYFVYLVVVLLLPLKLVYSSISRRQHNAAESARRGCEPPPTLSRKDPLGLSLLLGVLKAGREERGPQHTAQLIEQMGRDTHTIQVQILDSPVTLTRDPENAKAVLQSHDFDIGPYRANGFKPLLGSGLPTLLGKDWQESRSMLRPQFSRSQISDLDLLERHLQRLFQGLEPKGNGWTDKVDLQTLFYNLTLDTATEFLYGQSAHSQTIAAQQTARDTSLKNVHGYSDNPDQANFGHHFDEGKGWTSVRFLLGKWAWLVHSPQFSRNCRTVHKYVDRFVQKRLRDGPQHTGTEKKFILLEELAKVCQDPLRLRSETLHILSAGRDTTGALLSWIFYFLARHPRVFDKLRATIVVHFAAGVDFANLKTCDYLHACINETLRVAAVIPVMERVAFRDTVLARGGSPDGTKPIFIPKGQRILISNYAMQHRADIWGADFEDFRPERWEGRKAGWEFNPFGGGPRKCIGRECHSVLRRQRTMHMTNCDVPDTTEQFSLTETSYAVVRLLQRYDQLENLEPPGRIRFQHALSNRSGTGVQVRLHEAIPQLSSSQ